LGSPKAFVLSSGAVKIFLVEVKVGPFFLLVDVSAHLLRSLANDSRRVLVHERDGSILGFVMLRDGAHADYLGPMAARPGKDELLARSLLSGQGGRPIFWDIPDLNQPASDLARRLGFAFLRPLTRMFLDTNLIPSDPFGQWAIADPATG
jgi:hypothetical protein